MSLTGLVLNPRRSSALAGELALWSAKLLGYVGAEIASWAVAVVGGSAQSDQVPRWWPKQLSLISHSSGACKSKIEAPADSIAIW